jgi:hypothetical protein
MDASNGRAYGETSGTNGLVREGEPKTFCPCVRRSSTHRLATKPPTVFHLVAERRRPPVSTLAPSYPGAV